MATMIRSSLPNALYIEGLHEVFEAEGKDYTPLYTSLFNVNSSSKRFEEDYSTFGLGYFGEKDELGAIGEDQFGTMYTTRYVHRRFSKGFRLSHELMIDEMYGLWKRQVSSLKRLALRTQERDAFTVLNNAFTTNWNATAAVPLLSANHLLADGVTTNPNILSVAADFALTSLINMYVVIGNYKTPRGMSTQLTPNKLIGNLAQEFNFREVLNSTDRPDTADRAINPVYGARNLTQIVSPEITDTDAWFIQCAEHRLNWWNREGIASGDEVIAMTGGSRGDMFFFADYMASYGASDPIGMFGTPGAG